VRLIIKTNKMCSVGQTPGSELENTVQDINVFGFIAVCSQII